MTDDDSPIFRRRPMRKPQIIPPTTDSPSQGQPELVVPLPAASPAHESAIVPQISDDDSPIVRRRSLRNRAIIPLSPDSQAQPKLAVPPTPGSSALESAVASQSSDPISQNQPDPTRSGSSAPHSDVGSRWAEARQRDRASRRARRQRFLDNKLIAHQAKEVNDDDDSVDGTTNSEDDGYFFQDS
jgi:hypothetical protein